MRLLAAHDVRHLLVGGYAVGHYGYVRNTGDIDVWVERSPENAARLVEALHAFGFRVPELTSALFLEPDRVVRMGVPPIRIELLTSISGVDFAACHARRATMRVDDLDIPLIALDDLKRNKRASGRPKDLSDLDHLP